MTHSSWKTIVVLIMGCSGFAAYGAEPVEIRWDRVCSYTRGREVTIKSTTGETVSGYCFTVDVNDIAVETKDKRIVRVAKNTLSRMEMYQPGQHQLKSLGKGVHKELRDGFKMMFSPLAPVGLVVVPATLAWGALAAPFCILGDLNSQASEPLVIKPI